MDLPSILVSEKKPLIWSGGEGGEKSKIGSKIIKGN
jgi:hypothetical protein